MLASSESLQLEMDFETFFPTAEGSGDIHLEVGGQLVATPLPSFRSRRRQTLKMSAGRPWLKVGPFARSILRCVLESLTNEMAARVCRRGEP